MIDITPEQIKIAIATLLDEKEELEKENKILSDGHKFLNNKVEELEQELDILNYIQKIGREREYHSKFLKDFQKEHGKNVFPDHDEIYKRYDDYKKRVEKALKLNHDIQKHLDKEFWIGRLELQEQVLEGDKK